MSFWSLHTFNACGVPWTTPPPPLQGPGVGSGVLGRVEWGHASSSLMRRPRAGMMRRSSGSRGIVADHVASAAFTHWPVTCSFCHPAPPRLIARELSFNFPYFPLHFSHAPCLHPCSPRRRRRSCPWSWGDGLGRRCGDRWPGHCSWPWP